MKSLHYFVADGELIVAGVLLLSLILALWIAWLERVLKQLQNSKEVLAEALYRVAAGSATIRLAHGRILVEDR